MRDSPPNRAVEATVCKIIVQGSLYYQKLAIKPASALEFFAHDLVALQRFGATISAFLVQYGYSAGN